MKKRKKIRKLRQHIRKLEKLGDAHRDWIKTLEEALPGESPLRIDVLDHLTNLKSGLFGLGADTVSGLFKLDADPPKRKH